MHLYAYIKDKYILYVQAMLFNTHAVLETSLESREYPLFQDIRSIGQILLFIIIFNFMIRSKEEFVNLSL